ncbi:MAG: septum formation initiator family protein [Dehalococcoidia bacterium]
MALGDRAGGILSGLSLQRIVIATALFIVIYSGFTIAGNAARSYQLDAQTRQLEQDIAHDQGQYRKLDAVRRYMRTDEFIESSARKEGLVHPGDTTIIASAPASSPSPAQTAPGAWWERYYGQ